MDRIKKSIETILKKNKYYIEQKDYNFYLFVGNKKFKKGNFTDTSKSVGLLRLGTSHISDFDLKRNKKNNREETEEEEHIQNAIYVTWISIIDDYQGKGLATLLLAYGILTMYFETGKIYKIIYLEDMSDNSKQIGRNIYFKHGFYYIDVSLEENFKILERNEDKYKLIKKDPDLPEIVGLLNISPHQLELENRSLIGTINDPLIDDDSDDESVTTNNLTQPSQPFEEFDVTEFEDDDLLERKLEWGNTDARMITTIEEFSQRVTNMLPHIVEKLNKLKKLAKGTMKKRKYGTKRRVKSFKRNVKSKIKRENLINLTRSKSSSYSDK
jgi:GNAT superfamily N-acetyltransferase